MNAERKARNTLRRINASKVTKAVKKLFIEANTVLGEDVIEALQQALSREESQAGKQVLQKIIENADIARRKKVPICQDTGLAVVFVELGEDVHITGGPLHAAIEEGVRQAYAEGYLRKSVVVGLTGTDLSADRVNEIRTVLGFDEAIAIDRNPSDIRRAFDMVSKSIARG